MKENTDITKRDEKDLIDILAVFIKQKWLIISIVIIIFILFVIYMEELDLPLSKGL